MLKNVFASYAVAFLSIVGTSAAHANNTGSFNTGNGGWAVGNMGGIASVDSPGSATWVAGGPTGGYIQTFDTKDIMAFFAPAAYLGNKSNQYGQTVSYDTSDAFSDNQAYVAMVLYGNGQAISVGSQPPSTALLGSHFSFTLTETNFSYYSAGGIQGFSPVNQADFQAILGNLTNIAIHADWKTGADDVALDNFTFGTFQSALPEPASWAMLIAGFGLTGAAMRRRRAANA